MWTKHEREIKGMWFNCHCYCCCGVSVLFFLCVGAFVKQQSVNTLTVPRFRFSPKVWMVFRLHKLYTNSYIVFAGSLVLQLETIYGTMSHFTLRCRATFIKINGLGFCGRNFSIWVYLIKRLLEAIPSFAFFGGNSIKINKGNISYRTVQHCLTVFFLCVWRYPPRPKTIVNLHIRHGRKMSNRFKTSMLFGVSCFSAECVWSACIQEDSEESSDIAMACVEGHTARWLCERWQVALVLFSFPGPSLSLSFPLALTAAIYQFKQFDITHL